MTIGTLKTNPKTLFQSVVIGNGKSRKQIDLNSIRHRTFGCNAVYRDFSPDVLVSVDNGMMQEIYTEYSGNASIRFRVWEELPADTYGMFPTTEPLIVRGEPCASYTLNGAPWGTHITWCDKDLDIQRIVLPGCEDWSTGTTAIRLAAAESIRVYLLGFDMGSTSADVNNVYAGTLNYVPEGHSAYEVYERRNSAENWRSQHCRNFVEYPNVHFVIVGGGLKPEWTDEYRNVSYISIDSFKDIM